MMLRHFRIVPATLLAVALVWFAAACQARPLPQFTDLVREAGPAVVNISTTQTIKGHRFPGFEMPEMPEGSPFNDFFKHFFGEEGQAPPEFDAKSLGSGFIISEDGYILTNYHVVKDADEIVVRLSDRRQLEAEVVGGDERSDVALLKIDADELPVAKIGSATDLAVGEWVLAIGSPFGFDHSATAGIVSAKGRSLPRENYVPFIQTDVAINPGNSGGPLYNLDGEVVGVNSQIYSRTGGYMGVSFAIPIDVAMDVAEQLKTTGHVSRGWLGVMIQDVTRELAESFGMRKPRGALVAKVMPDSPAGESGLRVGDVIVRYDGREVTTSSALPPMVGSTKAGTTVELEVIREGEERSVDVTVGELPEQEQTRLAAGKPDTASAGRLGLTVADLSPEQREKMDLPENGVVVTEVQSGPAQRAGIRGGDVIVSVNNQPVEEAGQFRDMIEELPAGASVAVLVQRSSGPLFLALRIPEDE